jgi:hypothetical protein
MAVFDIDLSVARAERRLGSDSRKRRSDRGELRLDPRVTECVAASLGGFDRPPMTRLLEEVAERCRRQGLAAPARATVYKLLRIIDGPHRRVGDLPGPVQAALYNLEADSVVPERQVAFYCFNYGDLSAMSFAAGLPWLALHQARHMPGHRPRSLGLLRAVLRARGIEDGRA